MSNKPPEKPLPLIKHRLATFGQCEEDYVVYGIKISDISKRHGVPTSTLFEWKDIYGWDDQKSCYLITKGTHLRIVKQQAEKALQPNADTKVIQLYKDLYAQFIATDPNMKPIPNKERAVIVKMTIDSIRKKHAGTMDRYLSEPEYEELIDDVASY